MKKHGVERKPDGGVVFFWNGEELSLEEFNRQVAHGVETALHSMPPLGKRTVDAKITGRHAGKPLIEQAEEAAVVPEFDEIRDMLTEANEEALLADGFEDALIGFAEAWLPAEKDGKVTGCSPGAIALYDKEKCIEVLMKRDGMTDEEASEYVSFNVIGAYMGPSTPAFATILRKS